MSDLEDEMRRAFFGAGEPQLPVDACTPVLPDKALTRKPAKAVSPKLRVTLNVTKVFEGEIDVLIHDANTLSTLTAELEAKAKAKKLKYKYIDVVSIKSIE
ncbi:hypothetical protein [Pseudomonas izuensis]|uniref:hypothetical protein n=1 Tax=Pseudomonas izuensis TaxID=2684212 RepID=UPI001357D84A|nr:hypothetical protein [Pseudomonas izuensis]